VTDVHIPEAGQPVEVCTTLDVLDHRATSPDVDDGLSMVERMVERVNQESAVGGGKRVGHHRVGT
jgi:hypothetical protein